jgi:cysteinyl-tRNA synthetase
MSLSRLGQQIDIHGGGNDLIFPHHENEIAQTEAITGKPFARYWMHNGMLQLKGEKMSKSLGNLVSINDFLKDHSGDVMRLIVLSSHYRSPLTFNDEVVEANERAYERLLSALKPALPNASGASDEVLERLTEQTKTTETGFTDAMDDDFNTAGALGQLFDLVRVINQARSENATDAELAPAQDKFKELTGVLGLELKGREQAASSADAFIELLLTLRQELRQSKNYALADRVRDELAELGVVIEDTGQGSTWHWA